MGDFSFTIHHKDIKSQARTGVIHTPHGDIQTPAFVPVGTQATVKSLTPDELESLGVELFFANTYHAYLRPGIEVIKKFGGLHRFMHWDHPLITDSGGFQVFSLGEKKFSHRHSGLDRDDNTPRLVHITEDGVEFQSHWDGSKHIFTPEFSMQLQWELGSDIHIAFDECAPYPTTHEYAKKAMERTHRWAGRSVSENAKCRMLALSEANGMNAKSGKPYQALYGVIQGSIFEDLRKESANYIGKLDTDGIAIGGVSVGESKVEMRNVLDWVCPLLPDDKPRHLLGVGEIDDIFTLVEHGVDTFDCVQPTRLARVGRVLIGNNPKTQLSNNPMKKFEIDIMKSIFAEDTAPVDPSCRCYTCLNFSRAYLHHLFRVRELLGYRLATIHNIFSVNRLVSQIRTAITENRFLELKKKWIYT